MKVTWTKKIKMIYSRSKEEDLRLVNIGKNEQKEKKQQ